MGIDMAAVAATFVRDQTEEALGLRERREPVERVGRRGSRGVRFVLLLLAKVGLLLLPS